MKTILLNDVPTRVRDNEADKLVAEGKAKFIPKWMFKRANGADNASLKKQEEIHKTWRT